MSERVMTISPKEWIRDHIFLGKSIGEYIRGLITPWNMVAAVILSVGIPVMIYRIVAGLGASTNLSDTNPWGLWLAFDMFFGVAIATGGFVMAVGVYVFGYKEYKPMVRPAILTGFLGYFLAIVGLCFDLGRYYRLPYPLTISMGTASVLFLVAEHLALYLTIQFIEFLPAVVEWLNLKKLRLWLGKIHMGAVILGAVLVMGHQSALGAVFLLMPSRLHPLWYSPYLPYLFFVSCMAGGIAMLVVESLLSHKVFGHQVEADDHEKIDRLTIGLGKAAGFTLFAYFALKVLALIHGMNWQYLASSWGALWFFEVGGFVLLPLYMYTVAVRRQNAKLVRIASVLTVLGIMVNRFNVGIVALNWQASEVYVPHWMEVMLSLTLATIGVLVFKWIVNRMPVLYRLPDFPDDH